jgi:hypothetical protein
LTPKLCQKIPKSCHAPYIVEFFTKNYTPCIKERREYLINMLPSKVINNDTPVHRLLGTRPNYTSLRVFGCACWPNLHPYNKRKLAFRSRQCVFIGYSPHHKGVKCLEVFTGRVYISRDVVFYEHVFPFKKLHPNAAALLQKEIILLDPTLQNFEQGDDFINDFMENTHATDPLSSPVCVLQDAVSQNSAPRKNLIQNGVPSSSQGSFEFSGGNNISAGSQADSLDMYALESSPVASDWVSGDSRVASEGRTGSDGRAPSSSATRRRGPAVSPVRRTPPRSSMPDRVVSASPSAELATPGATRSTVSKPAATPDAASPTHSTGMSGSYVPSPVECQSVAPARPST